MANPARVTFGVLPKYVTRTVGIEALTADRKTDDVINGKYGVIKFRKLTLKQAYTTLKTAHLFIYAASKLYPVNRYTLEAKFNAAVAGTPLTGEATGYYTKALESLITAMEPTDTVLGTFKAATFGKFVIENGDVIGTLLFVDKFEDYTEDTKTGYFLPFKFDTTNGDKWDNVKVSILGSGVAATAVTASNVLYLGANEKEAYKKILKFTAKQNSEEAKDPNNQKEFVFYLKFDKTNFLNPETTLKSGVKNPSVMSTPGDNTVDEDNIHGTVVEEEESHG